MGTLSREDVYGEVSAMLQEMFELEAEQISPDARLYQDLDLDSIDAVDLVVKLQERTGKKIKPDEFKSVRTVEDVVKAIEDLLKS